MITPTRKSETKRFVPIIWFHPPKYCNLKPRYRILKRIKEGYNNITKKAGNAKNTANANTTHVIVLFRSFVVQRNDRVREMSSFPLLQWVSGELGVQIHKAHEGAVRGELRPHNSLEECVFVKSVFFTTLQNKKGYSKSKKAGNANNNKFPSSLKIFFHFVHQVIHLFHFVHQISHSIE